MLPEAGDGEADGAGSAERLVFDLGPDDDRLFIDESLEQIETIETGLLDLERGDASAQTVNEIFRGAHTLKGSAATIGHKRMAELTHALEDIFGALRSGTLVELGPFADVALSTIDVLRSLVEEVSAGRVLTRESESLTTLLRSMLDDALVSGPAHVAAAAGGERTVQPAGGGSPTADAVLERILRDAPEGDEARWIVSCRVDPASAWLAVRLLQAAVEAADSRLLRASVPSVEEIEGGLGQDSLTMLVGGAHDDVAALLGRLRAIDDMAEVTERPLAAGVGDRRVGNLGVEARGLQVESRLAMTSDRLKVAQQTIRIDVSRLDELMNLVGELVVQKERLLLQAHQLMGRLGDDPIARNADEGAQQFARIASQLQDHVTGLRMLPIETIFNRFPRVVRDLAAKLSKEVELIIEGKETELDRSVLEEVGDPLGHLVRNALDHGIEAPDVRAAAGKPATGKIRLSARHADGQIVITVEDDGRGMDAADLRRSAVEKGLLPADAAAALPDPEALRLIFLPGFSTAARITDVSGRGVGMDVVRTNIEQLGGRVDVASTPGTGTRITLSLPLTLAIIGAMLVRSGNRVCALPLTGVVETLRVDPSSISRVARHPVITLRGRVVPVAVLDTALGDPPHPMQLNTRGYINLVVVRSRDTELALAVEEFVGQQEIVLKSLSVFADRLVGISGATIMADGTVALVVDIAAVLRASATRLAIVA